jgi:hypothetical protein
VTTPRTRPTSMDVRRSHAVPKGSAVKGHIHLEVGAKQGRPELGAEGDKGVGGPHTSDDAGERVALDPAEQRGPVLVVSFRREP